MEFVVDVLRTDAASDVDWEFELESEDMVD